MEIESRTEEETGWEMIGQIEIRGRISISDSSYFYDQPVVIELESGKYSVSVSYAVSDGHKHIARARVATSEGLLKLGNEIGVVGIDFGQIAICDRAAVEAAFDVLGDRGMPEYFVQLNITDLTGKVRLPGDVIMFIFRPGFGDGNYPVYELLGLNGERSGLEIDCLKDII